MSAEYTLSSPPPPFLQQRVCVCARARARACVYMCVLSFKCSTEHFKRCVPERQNVPLWPNPQMWKLRKVRLWPPFPYLPREASFAWVESVVTRPWVLVGDTDASCFSVLGTSRRIAATACSLAGNLCGARGDFVSTSSCDAGCWGAGCFDGDCCDAGCFDADCCACEVGCFNGDCCIVDSCHADCCDAGCCHGGCGDASRGDTGRGDTGGLSR